MLPVIALCIEYFLDNDDFQEDYITILAQLRVIYFVGTRTLPSCCRRCPRPWHFPDWSWIEDDEDDDDDDNTGDGGDEDDDVDDDADDTGDFGDDEDTVVVMMMVIIPSCCRCCPCPRHFPDPSSSLDGRIE